jgi:hypothetical protein
VCLIQNEDVSVYNELAEKAHRDIHWNSKHPSLNEDVWSASYFGCIWLLCPREHTLTDITFMYICLYIHFVACLLKARIVKPAETALASERLPNSPVARQWRNERVSATEITSHYGRTAVEAVFSTRSDARWTVTQCNTWHHVTHNRVTVFRAVRPEAI